MHPRHPRHSSPPALPHATAHAGLSSTESAEQCARTQATATVPVAIPAALRTRAAKLARQKNHGARFVAVIVDIVADPKAFPLKGETVYVAQVRLIQVHSSRG